jgi:hypothetical protein
MAGGERTVRVRFTGDTSGLDRSARQAGAAMDGWRGKVAKFGAITAGVAAAAGVALFKLGKDAVSAFVKAEEAQAQLNDAFSRFPALADSSVESMNRLNQSLEKKIKFDDEALASGEAVLAQFKLSGKQVEALIPLVADYAAKTGKDLPEAATTLGKAFLGNTRALKELGISYKATGDQALDTANITKLLSAQVGGFAERQGKTAAGQAAILRNRFEDIQETIGSRLLPVLMALAAWGLRTIDWAERNQKVLIPLTIALAGVGAAILAVNAAMKVYAAVMVVIRAATVAATAVQWLLNLSIWACPITWIVAGIIALVAVIVLIATKTNWFQTIWRVAWTHVKAWAMNVWDWLKGLPGRIGDVFKAAAGFISLPFRMEFNAIARLWNNTIGKLSFHVPDWVPGLGGKGFSMPDLPTMHGGGIVPGPPGSEQLIRAQAGELVTPANQVGRPIVLENHIHIGDEVVRVVRTEIRESNRSLRRSVLAGAGAR